MRGYERFVTIIVKLFGGIGQVDDQDLFCGEAGGLKLCYTYCPSPKAGVVEKRSAELACLIYDNGNPPKPALLPQDALGILDLADSANVNNDFFCGIGTTTFTGIYCLPPCTIYRPITDNQVAKPCYFEYQGTLPEIIVARIYKGISDYLRDVDSVAIYTFSFIFEEEYLEENEFCPFTSLNEDKTACSSDTRRWCRPDSGGVLGLPAGETRCLIYLNGPAAAVGVLAATSLGGITTISSSFLGMGFLGAVGTSGGLAFGFCPSPFYCQVGQRCCLIVMGTNGLR